MEVRAESGWKHLALRIANESLAAYVASKFLDQGRHGAGRAKRSLHVLPYVNFYAAHVPREKLLPGPG